MKKFISNYFNKLLSAWKNTWDGAKALWANEWAFRQECYASIILTPIILLLNIDGILKLILLLLLIFLLIIESINSAIEAIVDRISLELHPKSKIAKDIGSATVVMAIVMNILAWLYAFYCAFS